MASTQFNTLGGPGDRSTRFTKVVLAVVIAVLAFFALMLCWPFYSVPTGSRGVLTQFGAIKGIESEGLVIVPPW